MDIYCKLLKCIGQTLGSYEHYLVMLIYISVSSCLLQAIHCRLADVAASDVWPQPVNTLLAVVYCAFCF